MMLAAIFLHLWQPLFVDLRTRSFLTASMNGKGSDLLLSGLGDSVLQSSLPF
jgi:hypothetical protein